MSSNIIYTQRTNIIPFAYKHRPKYCVYLTTYLGNKLPMFYIGSSLISRIINDNYHGSVSSKEYKDIWKSEIKLNPHLFKTQIVAKTQSRKNALYIECKLQEKLNVVKSPMYTNKALAKKNGFFGMSTKDIKGMLGKNHSKETLAKMSESAKTRVLSDEGRKALSNRNCSEETRAKISKKKLENIPTDKEKNNISRIKAAGNRDNVNTLRKLVKEKKIKLGTGWAMKNEEWINLKIAEITKEKGA